MFAIIRKILPAVLMLLSLAGSVRAQVQPVPIDKVPMAPARLIKADGRVIDRGMASTAAARATAAKALIEAAVSGDCVDLGSSSYAATASVTVPDGVKVVAANGGTWTATGLTAPAFIVAANSITLDGLTITSDSPGIGLHSNTPTTITGLTLRNLVVTSSASNGASWMNSAGSGDPQHTIIADIDNCKFIAGNSVIGIRASLSSTSRVRVHGGYVFGGADGCLWNGHTSAEVYLDGGIYGSDIDAVTTGGPKLYLFGGLRARGGITDIYADGGTIFAADIDIVLPGESGITYTQTYHGLTPTAAGLALLDDANAAAQRTTLGLGTIATQAASSVSITGGSVTGITDLTVADGGTGASTLTGILKGNGTSPFTSAVAGTDYLATGQVGSTIQAFDPDLDSLAALSGTDNMYRRSAANTWSAVTFTSPMTFSSGAISVAAASTSASGISELATSAETTTGTDIVRTLTPDGLAHSNYGKRPVTYCVGDPQGSAITTGDGKIAFRVPPEINGFNLVAVGGGVTTVSSSGIPTFQLRRSRRTNATTRSDADMLSTKLTVDASEFDSVDASTAAVVDAANDDVNTGDMIYVDIDVAGTGCKGPVINLSFQLP